MTDNKCWCELNSIKPEECGMGYIYDTPDIFHSDEEKEYYKALLSFSCISLIDDYLLNANLASHFPGDYTQYVAQYECLLKLLNRQIMYYPVKEDPDNRFLRIRDAVMQTYMTKIRSAVRKYKTAYDDSTESLYFFATGAFISDLYHSLRYCEEEAANLLHLYSTPQNISIDIMKADDDYRYTYSLNNKGCKKVKTISL